MRTTLIPLILFLLTSGCGQQNLTVEADLVDFDQATQTLVGNWQIRDGGDRSSRGTGGACIVVKLDELWPSDVKPSCAADADCQGYATKTFGVGSYGYCHERACWLKPPGTAHNYCNRTPDAIKDKRPTRWDIGKHVTNIVPIDLDQHPVPGHRWPRLTKWRTTACLNDFDRNARKDFAACPDPNPNPNRQSDWGAVRDVVRDGI